MAKRCSTRRFHVLHHYYRGDVLWEAWNRFDCCFVHAIQRRSSVSRVPEMGTHGLKGGAGTGPVLRAPRQYLPTKHNQAFVRQPRSGGINVNDRQYCGPLYTISTLIGRGEWAKSIKLKIKSSEGMRQSRSCRKSLLETLSVLHHLSGKLTVY